MGRDIVPAVVNASLAPHFQFLENQEPRTKDLGSEGG